MSLPTLTTATKHLRIEISQPNRRLLKGYKQETALDSVGAVVALYTIVIVLHVLKKRAVIKVQSGLRGTNRLRLAYLVDCAAGALVLEGSGRPAAEIVGSDVVGDACEIWVVSDDGRTDALGPVEVGSLGNIDGV